jgi:hypothetical protein
MEPSRFVKPPEFIVTNKEGMQLLYVTGVFGGLAPNDARMLLYTDRLEPEPAEMPGAQKVKRVNQEIQAEVHMSPATFKSIALWMLKNLQNYEQTFGEIKAEPIKESSPSKGDYVK